MTFWFLAAAVLGGLLLGGLQRRIAPGPGLLPRLLVLSKAALGLLLLVGGGILLAQRGGAVVQALADTLLSADHPPVELAAIWLPRLLLMLALLVEALGALGRWPGGRTGGGVVLLAFSASLLLIPLASVLAAFGFGAGTGLTVFWLTLRETALVWGALLFVLALLSRLRV